MSRFDRIEFTADARIKYERFKTIFENIEDRIEKHIPNGRSKTLALTHIEEAFGWIEKAIRDEQIQIQTQRFSGDK
jgi:hypothetical protein